jgi:sortase A
MGAVLLSLYAVPTIYGSAMSHLAVAQFRAQSQSNSLWDSARIRAYQQTLHLNFAPPEAILRVPRIGIEVPVLEGVSDAALNRGAGHIPGTALPGESNTSNNIGITGHRDGFFRPLKDIAIGDVIELDIPAAPNRPAHTDRFAVRKINVVFPDEISVLNHTDNSTLTLVTCYPFYFVGAAPQRYIVQAQRIQPTPQSNSQNATGDAL